MDRFKISNLGGFDELIHDLVKTQDGFLRIRSKLTNPVSPQFIKDFNETQSIFKNDGNIRTIQIWQNTISFVKYPKICINEGRKFDLTEEYTTMVNKGNEVRHLLSSLFNLYGPGTYNPSTFILGGQDKFTLLLEVISDMIKIIEQIKITYNEFKLLWYKYIVHFDYCLNFKPLKLSMRTYMKTSLPLPGGGGGSSNNSNSDFDNYIKPSLPLPGGGGGSSNNSNSDFDNYIKPSDYFK
jgi:hypothetical protein